MPPYLLVTVTLPLGFQMPPLPPPFPHMPGLGLVPGLDLVPGLGLVSAGRTWSHGGGTATATLAKGPTGPP